MPEELRPEEEFVLLERQLADLEMARSLRDYTAGAWSIVEPNIFVDNWHIGALCEHLEAVTCGEILYLLVTMPPRHSKSLVLSVLWPTWEWLQLPSYRWVFASYAFSLSVRDSLKRRNIIQSRWYQERWADRYQLIKEQNSKVRYENDHQGFMLASSVGGSNTGEGGERIVADDPHNVKKGESEDVRIDTVNWWNIVMSTRRNDMVRSARVVVQQRVHEGDVAGNIIEEGGAVHLNLPAEFVPTMRCFTSWPGKDGREHTWTDPRTGEGELLNPLRFNEKAITNAQLVLGDYQYAAQYQQNPTPPEGTIIKKEWLRYYGPGTAVAVPDWAAATHAMTPLLALDCTFKEHKDTDYVAGLAWAMFGADIYLLPVMIHDRLSFTGTIDAVAELVGGKSLDEKRSWPGIYPFIKIKLVEDKANGPAIVDTLQHKIPGMLAWSPGSASKESRMQAVSWRFRAGNVYLPCEALAPWIKEYVYELCAFPKAKRDDYADATSEALLFIGGDPTATEPPVMTAHESTWTGLGGSHTPEEFGGATSPSTWGQMSRWGAH